MGLHDFSHAADCRQSPQRAHGKSGAKGAFVTIEIESGAVRVEITGLLADKLSFPFIIARLLRNDRSWRAAFYLPTIFLISPQKILT